MTLNASRLVVLVIALSSLILYAKACRFHLPTGEPFNYTQAAEANNAARSSIKQSSSGYKILIKNVRVFDGHKIQKARNVVIDGSKIGKDPAGADQVIDGQGMVLLPGLIDAHSHPSNITHLQDLSRYGVTTAQVMACYSPQLCKSLQNHTGLVDLRLASAAAAAPLSAHGNITIRADPTGDLLVNDTSQAAAWVERQVAWGPDYIKMVAESPGLDETTLAALTNAARQHKKRSICHASINSAYDQAIKARFDHIHHAPLDFALTSNQVHRAFKQKQISTPTLSILKAAAANRPGTDNFTAAVESVRMLHKAKVPITAGTDANLQPGIVALLPFGSCLHEELELLVEAGLSPLEALQSATSRSAALWKFDDRGVIAPGKRADLLLVDGDPTKDIRATRNIRRVWLNGVEYNGTLGTF